MFQTLLQIVRMSHPKNVLPPPRLGSVIFRMQGAEGCVCVICHVSCIMCHLSHVNFFIRPSGGASRWRVCYQRGLLRLVIKCSQWIGILGKNVKIIYIFFCSLISYRPLLVLISGYFDILAFTFSLKPLCKKKKGPWFHLKMQRGVKTYLFLYLFQGLAKAYMICVIKTLKHHFRNRGKCNLCGIFQCPVSQKLFGIIS